VGKGSFDNPGKKLINTQLGAAWHTGQNSLVQTGTAGNIVKMAFLKLLQNTDTVGKFFNSRGREFHASGAVTQGAPSVQTEIFILGLLFLGAFCH
jgi:hypothetical protein